MIVASFSNQKKKKGQCSSGVNLYNSERQNFVAQFIIGTFTGERLSIIFVTS